MGIASNDSGIGRTDHATAVRLPVRFGRNLTSGYMMTVTLAVIGLVMTPVLISGLGKEAYGVWVVVGSLAIYRELLELGFAKATPKYVAHYAALGKEDEMRASIATSFWILAAAGGLALVLGLALAAGFPALFNPSPEVSGAAQVLVLIVAIDLAISIPTDAFGGTLSGLQRYDLLYGTLIVVAIAQAIGWVIVIVAGGGLVLLGVVTVTLSLAGQLWRYLLVRRLLPGTSVSPRLVDRSLVKPFAKLSVWFGLIDVSSILLIRIDTIVVGVVLGVEAAAIYAVGQKLPQAAAQISRPISGLFFPHSSELTARDDSQGLRESLVSGTRLLVAIGIPMAILMSFLAGTFIDAWVGPGFEDATSVVVILAGSLILYSLTLTGLVMLQGMGEPRRPAIITAVEAVLNLGLSVFFAHLMGLAGVALGTLTASAVMNMLVFFPYMCRQFDLSAWRLLGTLLLAHVPPAASASAVGWLILRADPSGWLALAGAGFAITLAYVAVYPLTALDRSERRIVAGRIRAKVALS